MREEDRKWIEETFMKKIEKNKNKIEDERKKK